MTRKQQMLLVITQFLSPPENAAYTVLDDARDLWNILTALRGPDSGDDGLKQATTGVIRYMMLGKNAGFPHDDDERNLHGSIFGPDKPEYAEIRKNKNNSHFLHHAELAFSALGLSWGRVNTQDPPKDWDKVET